MSRARAPTLLVALVVAIGCQVPPGPIFPEVIPPIVWPQPPDQPRVRYIGELRGQSSLGARPSGWEAFRAALAGPKPRLDFSRPVAVAVRAERVYVADIGLGLVHMLDLEKREYGALRGAAGDPLRVPIDLAIRPDGSLLVMDRGRAAIDCLGSDGQFRSTTRWPELSAPVAITTHPVREQYWLLDAVAHACFLWSPQNKTLTPALGGRGGGIGELNYPSGLTWHAAIGLVVADAMNFRVQVFDAGHRPVLAFGQKGDAAGDFARPRDVAVDSDGHIYVLDNQFENVQIFDRQGRLLMAFGQGGDGPGEFSLPSGITIDEQDRIWVADSYNRRVQVFQYLSEKTSWAE